MWNIVWTGLTEALFIALLVFLYRQMKQGRVGKRPFYALFIGSMPGLLFCIPFGWFFSDFNQTGLDRSLALFLFDHFPPHLGVVMPVIAYKVVVMLPLVLATGWSGAIMQKRWRGGRQAAGRAT